MNEQEKQKISKLRKLIHQNDILIRIMKAYCKSELNYSMDIESLFLHFDNMTKNQDQMSKILDKAGL